MDKEKLGKKGKKIRGLIKHPATGVADKTEKKSRERCERNSANQFPRTERHEFLD